MILRDFNNYPPPPQRLFAGDYAPEFPAWRQRTAGLDAWRYTRRHGSVYMLKKHYSNLKGRWTVHLLRHRPDLPPRDGWECWDLVSETSCASAGDAEATMDRYSKDGPHFAAKKIKTGLERV